MAKPSKGRHTVASLDQVLERLKEITAQVQVSKTLMEMSPTIPELDVLYEVSLIDGMRFVQQWADALRDAARDARLAATRNGSVSDSKPVSDSPKNEHKTRRK